MKIRYYGHVGQQTGYGRAASDLCMALLGAGVELEIRPMSPVTKRRYTDAYLPLASMVRTDYDMDPNPDAVIVHTLPMDCAQVRDTVQFDSRSKVSPSVPWVAYTTWEASTRPVELRARLYPFNQTWHPCKANADAIHGRVPTKILPHCFNPATLYDRRGPSDLPRENEADAYYFYFIGAWSERKQPRRLVQTFADEFGGDPDVQLVLRCADIPKQDSAWAKELLGSRVHLVGLNMEQISDAYITEMHKTFDCFVSASGGEAWNLPCFDALLAGRHIIATSGLGSDDYLLDTSADLCPSKPSPPWREPYLSHLARIMRNVVGDRARTLNVNYDPVERYGYPAVAQLAINYIAECYS